MASTGFYFHPAYLEHDTGPGHPERPDRLRAILSRLEREGLLDELDRRQPEAAEERWIDLAHRPGYGAKVRAGCQRGGTLDRGDTVVCPASWNAALLALGGSLEAVDAVQGRDLDNAFVACRPPGHHAEADTAMGFCLINNVAVAAAYLREKHGLDRVAVVDWDVHHGNGTQHIFERDPSVFYASLHQWPWYPGTGASSERGHGDGVGATLNCPMESGSGDADYLRAFEDSVMPALEDFAPQFVLVSAGFDAHVADPLSGTEVTDDGFRRMTDLLLDLARRHAGGRLVALLEGGYDLNGLATSTQAHLEALRADPSDDR